MKKSIKYIIIAIIVIAIIVTLVVLNINRNKQDNKEDGTLKIVTSFYPMYIIAENITEGAENIELVNMADVNVGCLHDYTLTTEDMKKVENADIFIMNGLGMESFIDKVISANTNMEVIDSSTNMQNIILDVNGVNAHIWTSIDNYILQVENIAEGLIQKDEANAEKYKANADVYIEKLEELKNSYSNELQELNGKKAICLNEAFAYLGQDLRLDMTMVETNHEESTMSAEMLRSIIDEIKNENIQVIIIDKNDSKTNAETIANETGAKIYELNSGLTGSTDKDSYINAMEDNLELLKSI